MRIFIAVLVLIFSLQSLTKADDIRDFEIEGISIGDSLLDYFSKNNIEKEKKSKFAHWYKDGKFVQIGIGKFSNLKKKLNIYDDMGVVLKPNDLTYKIHSVVGRIFCKNIITCKSKKNEVVKDLKLFFEDDDNLNIFDDDKNHAADKTGKSKTYITYFHFRNSDEFVEVSVYNWSKAMKKKKKYKDSLKVIIFGNEFTKFMRNEAYN